MEKKWIPGIILIMLLISIIAFLEFFVSEEPAITGFILYEEAINTLNWTFDDTNDYSYDGSLIEIDNGNAELVSTNTYTYWNTSTETEHSVTLALYNPNDKTDKVNSLDNKKHEVNGEKIFDIFFAEELDNNDIVSLYLEGNNEAEIYLCEKGTICGSSNYGLINFNGSSDWYNITMNNLESPTNIIGIASSGEVKFNYITSTKGDIAKALYNPSDRTSKIQVEDNNHAEADKNKLFNVIFSNNINNGDIISLYLKNNDEAADIYICSYGEDCSSPGYGSVSFDGNEGWYNITITNLNEPKDSFNINPSENIKIDFIKAVHTDITPHESTTISYPKSASIETNNIDITGLSSFLNFYKNDLPNGQYINYYYSIDSGNNWYNIPDDGDLSGISAANEKIRIKAELSSDGSATPAIYDFSVKYKAQICSPNWNCASYGECQLNNFKKCIAAEDNNLCYSLTTLSSDAYFGDYNEFNLSCVYNKTGIGFSNLSISAAANEKLIIDKTNSTDIILELNASNDLENIFVSIMKYSVNKKNTSPSLSALNKYLDIEANNSLKNSINSVKIRIYYTDEEIINANLDEETLRIYYFNESSSQWQVLDSAVNTTGNYIEVNIDHLSTFGIFGEEIAGEISGASESYSSGGSSGGGGGGSTRKIPKTAAKPVETEALPEKEETAKDKEAEMPKEAKEECNYKISVSMPEHVSFMESDHIKGMVNNIGNCKIEHLDIGISAELKDVIQIENERIENIEANKNAEFSLIKKLEAGKARNLIQGFNIKIPEGSIETYSGSLTFNAVVQDQLAFEEKVSIKVDLLKPISTAEIIKLNIPIFSVLLLILLGLFSVYSYRKRKKNTNHTL